jgi:hypothetical protein
LVAIPAVVSFNWLKAMLKKRVADTDFLCRIVIAQLKKRVDPFAGDIGTAAAADAAED